MTSVKIGLCLRFKNVPPWKTSWEQVYKDNLEYAAAADRLGFEGLWVPEHHCMNSGYNPAPLIALTALASVTRHCWLGTQPLLMPLHNPVLAAEEIAVLDVISGGRVALGLGGGYTASDFEALGVNIRERGGRSEEAIEIITRALRGDWFDFKGRFYDVKGVRLSPPPMQPNMAIQLMVRSAPAAKRAVRHGANANLLSPEGVLEFGPILVVEADRAGRDGKTIGASLMLTGFIDKSRAVAVEAARPYLMYQIEEYLENSKNDPTNLENAAKMKLSYERGDGPFTASEWIETISNSIAGIGSVGLSPDWINLTLWHSGMPVTQAIEALERFASDVLPKISR